ncbi:hypothetical protein [Pseudomonas sp. BGI-2]|uniref:hypothetical protein n=1 Tax=Pseudomonas sp. BGI-2 TaxID=2528211 RepID=UPI0010349431|nr:hypothetical protein [Pseudomonas sp. BGI-2]TBN49154.1 hypothetical protein EYC95_06325 [Pseudomonas sp. BGI-2]
MAKNAEQRAHETMHALIAGGCFPKGLISSTGEDLELNKAHLQQIEEQLHDYYSTGLHEPKESTATSTPLNI